MRATPLEDKIKELIAPSLAPMGYVIVRVQVRPSGRKSTLEVLCEKADGSGVGIDDCVQISHTVSALLEVNDPISGAYDLEVSSPGLDRPLVSLADFERFKGQEAKVEMMLPMNGTKRFRGVIESVLGDEVRLSTENGEVTLSFSGMRSARLAVSESTVRAALKDKKKAG